MKLILARHGQSMANADPNWRGEDPPLTSLGEQQADLLGRWLEQHYPDIDTVVASPLSRAKRTAEIACQHLKQPLHILETLREIQTWDFPLLPKRIHPLDATQTVPGDDPTNIYGQFRLQVMEAMEWLMRYCDHPNPILVVSHGGTMATMLRVLFNVPDVYFVTVNTGIHTIIWKEGHWSIHGINQMPHLVNHPTLMTH
jgi:broad specificity phosphatase PhoE